MKNNKVLLIVQVVLMYLAQLPFYIGLILTKVPNNSQYDDLIIKLILIGFILTILILPIALVNAIMALISHIKGDYNPTKVTMISKLLLIPWYVMNFCLCVLIVVGFMNPWLMLFAPVVAFFLICMTYILMLSTSIFDIAYFFKRIRKKEIFADCLYIFTMIFLFSFCLDVIGSIIFYIRTNKSLKAIPSE